MVTWRKIKEEIDKLSDEELDGQAIAFDSEQDDLFPAEFTIVYNIDNEKGYLPAICIDSADAPLDL